MFFSLKTTGVGGIPAGGSSFSCESTCFRYETMRPCTAFRRCRGSRGKTREWKARARARGVRSAPKSREPPRPLFLRGRHGDRCDCRGSNHAKSTRRKVAKFHRHTSQGQKTSNTNQTNKSAQCVASQGKTRELSSPPYLSCGRFRSCRPSRR